MRTVVVLAALVASPASAGGSGAGGTGSEVWRMLVALVGLDLIAWFRVGGAVGLSCGRIVLAALRFSR